jgi:hypothetical protein
VTAGRNIALHFVSRRKELTLRPNKLASRPQKKRYLPD